MLVAFTIRKQKWWNQTGHSSVKARQRIIKAIIIVTTIVIIMIILITITVKIIIIIKIILII